MAQDDVIGYGNFDIDPPRRLFPEVHRVLSPAVPAELREAHKEARKTFDAKAYLAAVVMCGRTLEGACAEQGITKGTLQQQLKEMKEQDIIDARLWEWAQLLREVRNHGAHYRPAAPSISRQDADDCLTFNEALLDYLYVLKQRFDTMRARRAP